MLTKLTIRNFKRFNDLEAESGNPLVFADPNNSSKTSIIHPLVHWDTGPQRWNQKGGAAWASTKTDGALLLREDCAGPLVKRSVVSRIEQDGQNAAICLGN